MIYQASNCNKQMEGHNGRNIVGFLGTYRICSGVVHTTWSRHSECVHVTNKQLIIIFYWIVFYVWEINNLLVVVYGKEIKQKHHMGITKPAILFISFKCNMWNWTSIIFVPSMTVPSQ